MVHLEQVHHTPLWEASQLGNALREFIDDIAPDMRRLSQLTGTTLEDAKQDTERIPEQTILQ